MNFPILSSLILLPVIGALFLFFTRDKDGNNLTAKYVSLFTSIANFLISIYLWFSFDQTISNFQFIEDRTWIDGFGPDGISSFIKKCSIKANKFQSGFIYQYAFVMLLGFSALLTFLIIK